PRGATTPSNCTLAASWACWVGMLAASGAGAGPDSSLTMSPRGTLVMDTAPVPGGIEAGLTNQRRPQWAALAATAAQTSRARMRDTMMRHIIMAGGELRRKRCPEHLG